MLDEITEIPGLYARGHPCYYLAMRFVQHFKKTASMDSLRDVMKSIRKPWAQRQIAKASDSTLRHALKKDIVRYSEIGKAPRIGKSGNPLTAEYMAKTYGIKGYKEQA